MSRPSRRTVAVPHAVEALYDLDPTAETEPLEFVIVDIKKFQVTNQFVSAISEETEEKDAYDIFIADGTFLTKCVLHPSLNYLIDKHHLYTGCSIQVLQFRRRYDEKQEKALGPFIIFTNIERVGTHLTTYDPEQLAQLRWLIVERWQADAGNAARLSAKSDEERDKWLGDRVDDLFHVPLVGGRGTYVHILANDCPMGVKWSPKDLAGDDISVIDEAIDIAHHKILTIEEFTSDFIRHGKHPPYRREGFNPVLYGRIMRKGRLYNFAARSHKSKEFLKYPFKFSFTLRDTTGEVEVVVWQRVCATAFHSINVGDVVLLSQFRSKLPFKGNEPAAPSDDEYMPHEGDTEFQEAQLESLPSGVVEIALNPGCKIRVVHGPILNDDMFDALPGLHLDPKTAAELSALQSGSKVDLCGLVVFAGEINRTSYGSASRWLLLRTEVGQQFWVRIVPNSDFATFESIQVGDVLLATSLKLYSIVVSSRPPTTRLISTIWTQLITDPAQLKSYADAGFDAINAPLALRDDKVLIRHLRDLDAAVGNAYRQHFPFCFGLVKHYQEFYPVNDDEITMIRDIPSICDALKWRETRHIRIRGFVKSITFVERKQKYDGATIDKNQKFPSNPDKTAPTKRPIYLLHVEDVNREKSVQLAIPVLPVLYESQSGSWEGLLKENQQAHFRRLLRFFGYAVPELRNPATVKAISSSQDQRQRMKLLTAVLTGDAGKRAAPEFQFGVSLTRTKHDDVECVISNAFPPN